VKSDLNPSEKKYAKNTWELAQFHAGIPRPYWGPINLAKPDFGVYVWEQYEDERGAISPARQSEWYKTLLDESNWLEPFLIIISSDKDDGEALRVGLNLIKKATQLPKYKTHVANSMEFNAVRNRKFIGPFEDATEAAWPDICLLYNVFDDSSMDRIQQVRDWSKYFENRFRIICAGGDTGELIKKLKLDTTAAFFLKKQPKVMVRV
tara:strand:+ start:72880 stop:73500 length:621 start_codon:yes stop_codon:yes gene_type:complete